MQRRVTVVLVLFTLVSILAVGCSGGAGMQRRSPRPTCRRWSIRMKVPFPTFPAPIGSRKPSWKWSSMQSVKAELKDVSCKVSGTDGDKTLVSCQGSIQFTYTNESQQLDLSQRTYEMAKEGGEWRVCGYH